MWDIKAKERYDTNIASSSYNMFAPSSIWFTMERKNYRRHTSLWVDCLVLLCCNQIQYKSKVCLMQQILLSAVNNIL